MSVRSPLSAEFARRLQALRERDNRQGLAALRRGLDRALGEDSPSTAAFYRLLPPGLDPTDEPSYFLAATLFARQPLQRPAGGATADEEGEAAAAPRGDGFAAVLARLALRPNVNREGVERRFVALLDADSAALPFRLRQVMGLFRGHADLSWDWASLIDDLCRWSLPSRTIQRAWARSFFSHVGADDRTDASPKEDSDAD